MALPQPLRQAARRFGNGIRTRNPDEVEAERPGTVAEGELEIRPAQKSRSA